VGLSLGCVNATIRAGSVFGVIAVRSRSSVLFVAIAAGLLLAGCGSSAPKAAGDTAPAAAVSVDASQTTVPTETPPPGPAVAGQVYGTTPCAPAGGTPAPVRMFASPFEKCIDPAKTYTATMVTSKGTMIFTLNPAKAPGTVNNFVNLARSKYFDGIYFHRVVQDFVLQAGDPNVINEAAITGGKAGVGGPGYNFADELPNKGEYKIGDLAMANAGPNTNGSQFFVISGPNGAALDPNYALFGSMTADPATAATIKAIGALAPPAPNDGPPSEAVVIQSVTIAET
jgi:cyclophilin family peptidyl-prolyl cis-trans isomerase